MKNSWVIMTKASDAVKTIISNNNIYSLLINTGLVNYTKMAKKIKSRVEFLVGKKIKLNTIVKALTNIEVHGNDADTLDILKKSSLLLEYNYEERHSNNIDDVMNGAMLIVREKDGFTSLIKSNNINSFVIAKIMLPENALTTAGITLLITEFLTINGIQVRNIYRLSREIWIIVDSEVAGKVADALNRLLYQNE